MVSAVDRNNTTNQQIKHLDINKAARESDMPSKIVKPFDNLIVVYLQENFNNRLKKGTFPKDFKKAVAHPTHKKDCKTKKSNYGPITIFPNLSKIHGRLLYDQIYTYFSNFFPQ